MSKAESELGQQWPPTPEAVEIARQGDQIILSGILAAGIPKLIGFYRGMGFSLADAEDLAADACEAIVRHLPRLRDVARFEAWFWRIARNKYHDQMRRKQRTVRRGEREAEFEAPDEGLVVDAEHEEVRRALADLSDRDRELLWMRDVVGLAYPEIGRRLRVTEGSLRVAIMRARRRLVEALTEGEQA